MPVLVNFSEIEDDDNNEHTEKYNSEREPLPEDIWYRVEIISCNEQVSTNGHEYFGLAMRVLEGRYKSRLLFDDIFFTEKSLPRLKYILKRLGWEDLPDGTYVAPEHFLGRQCRVTTLIEERPGRKPRNRIPFRGYDYLKGDDLPRQGEPTSLSDVTNEEPPF